MKDYNDLESHHAPLIKKFRATHSSFWDFYRTFRSKIAVQMKKQTAVNKTICFLKTYTLLKPLFQLKTLK